MKPTHLYNQSILHYPKTAYDRYGRETLGTPVSYDCRFQVTTKSRLQPNGQVITIDAIVYIDPTATIEINDKISYGGINYKVLGKSTAIDGLGGSNNTKLELTKWQTI